jgi:hypothetical protein
LGELFAQFADSKISTTKFRIIRLPEEITDPASVFGKALGSFFSSGRLRADFSDSESINAYYKNDLLPPLLKTIVSLMKSTDSTSSVYTVAPKGKEAIFEDFAKDALAVACLRKDKDARIIYNHKPEETKSDDLFSVVEPLEKTAIAGVLRTKFLRSGSADYKNVWTIEEIDKMTTRELISAVFQSLNEKIKTS